MDKLLYKFAKLISRIISGDIDSSLEKINKKEEIISITLEKSLRMKRNLGLFVKEFADKKHLPMNIEPNEKSGGGRVIILRGSYTNYGELNSSLLEDLKKSVEFLLKCIYDK